MSIKVGSCLTLITVELGYDARVAKGVISLNATLVFHLGLLGGKLAFPI